MIVVFVWCNDSVLQMVFSSSPWSMFIILSVLRIHKASCTFSCASVSLGRFYTVPGDVVMGVVGMDRYANGGLSTFNRSLVLEAKLQGSAYLSHVGATAAALHLVHHQGSI